MAAASALACLRLARISCLWCVSTEAAVRSVPKAFAIASQSTPAGAAARQRAGSLGTGHHGAYLARLPPRRQRLAAARNLPSRAHSAACPPVHNHGQPSGCLGTIVQSGLFWMAAHLSERSEGFTAVRIERPPQGRHPLVDNGDARCRLVQAARLLAHIRADLFGEEIEGGPPLWRVLVLLLLALAGRCSRPEHAARHVGPLDTLLLVSLLVEKQHRLRRQLPHHRGEPLAIALALLPVQLNGLALAQVAEVEHPERGLRLLCQPQQLSVLILRPAPVAAGLVAAAAGASDAAEHITAVLEQRTLVLQARGRCNQAAPFSL